MAVRKVASGHDSEKQEDQDMPQRYVIEKLLATAVQPFDPIAEEELNALVRDIEAGKQNPLMVPVILSREGIVVDGSQRLRAMQKLGHKYIGERDVQVAPQVTLENATEWAVRLNVRRRQLSIEDKARVGRRLQQERGWSQSKIAELFGVSRAAVSQWFGKTEPEDGTEERPEEVLGRDGRMQRVAQKQRKARLERRQTTPHPWTERGECIAQVKKATSRIQGAIKTLPNWKELDDVERDIMLVYLEELEVSAQQLIEEIRSEEAPKPKRQRQPKQDVGNPAVTERGVQESTAQLLRRTKGKPAHLIADAEREAELRAEADRLLGPVEGEE